MTARIAVADITARDVDCDALLASVSDDRAGAVVTFAGTVRNHDHGVAVTGIEYVGHPSSTGRDKISEKTSARSPKGAGTP